MNRAVFLDRDGVINSVFVRGSTPHPPASLEEFRFLPGVEQACQGLRAAGFMLIVVTNQPDVARGTQTREGVEALNDRVRSELPVKEVLTCYHDNIDNCDCRKPKPGLLLHAAVRWHLNLDESFMIGDRWSDVEAGQACGCFTILIERSYSRSEHCQPDWIVSDLATAAAIILERESCR